MAEIKKKPFASLTLDFYDMTTFEVASSGDVAKITVRLLERGEIEIRRAIDKARRKVFADSAPRRFADFQESANAKIPEAQDKVNVG